MSEFKPILTMPKNLTTSKYWKHTSVGGLNSCIRIKNGLCIPNCVGYSWGRAYQLLGKKPKLARTNASTWFNHTSDGYTRGYTPKLGAIACWGGGSHGKGHVANVEKIYNDGSILCSNSGASGTMFFMKKYIPPYDDGTLKFQGFIYLPIEDTHTQSTTPVLNDYYFTFGDRSIKIGQVAKFMRKVFPLYTKRRALGNLLGKYLQSSLLEFQKRSGIPQTGNIDEKTINELKKYGFKW